LAHDEQNQYKVGDIVKIQECAPMSKRKTWFVKEKIGESRR
ncbi:MAG TPA: 30S ribosomal protein S17, partial [bacterium]|nr:30S ribosomal protein S17 [bacterium]